MNLLQKVSKEFLRNAPSDKVTFGQNVVDGLNAHASLFPALPYSVVVMGTANTTLFEAIAAAKSGNHADIQARNNKEKAWNNIWSKTADYVSFIAAGNAETITLAGFTPTSGTTTPKAQPGQALLRSMGQHDGGTASIEMFHPGAGAQAVAAYMYLAVPTDTQISTAADGTITIMLPNGMRVYAKCDTHNATSMGGMTAGAQMKLVVQPVNRAGAGTPSTEKTFTPQQ